MSKERGLEKPREKKLRNTTLKEELWTFDYITQATPMMIFVSYTLNFSSKPPMIFTISKIRLVLSPTRYKFIVWAC